MIPGGYYIKARKIQESEIAHMPPHVREIWDWLIKEANHKEVKVHGALIKRGQCFRSYRDIQEGLHWMVGWRKQTYSRDACEAALKILRRGGMITTRRTTRGLLISVEKYDYYQDPESYENHTQSQIENPDSPHTLQSINKNEKNEKKKEEDKEAEQSSAEKVRLSKFSSEGADLIKSFEAVNPACKRYYANVTQRQACEDLISSYGFDRVKKIIESTLPRTNKIQYFPSITTPLQLREKWSSLENSVTKYKSQSISKVPNVVISK